MKALIIDTETSSKEGEIIELAHMEVQSDGRMKPETLWSARYKPKGLISFGAMAVHHIIPDDLKDQTESHTAVLPEDTAYIIGHNVDFDWRMLGQPRINRICTFALARDIWPEEEGHTLGACIYRISENKSVARGMLKDAHSAAHDVMLCAALLEHFVTKYFPFVTSMAQLYEISEQARIPKRWTFGKFMGRPFEDADRGYMNWCLRQPDMDEYVKKACRQHLER